MTANKLDGRSIDHTTSEFIRLNAVERVLNGEKPSSVMASYGLCRTTIYKWLKTYEEGGWEALQSRPITGRPPILSDEECLQVGQRIVGGDPRQLGLDLGLWTRRVVADMIQDMFGVEIGLTAVGRMLHRIGIVPVKPLRRAYERDPVAIEKWKEEEYPALRERAKKYNAEIYFLDEAGIRSDSVLGKTWGPKGERTTVETSGRRQSVNVVSAVSEEGGFWFDIYSGMMNAEKFIDTLHSLMSRRQRPVYVVLDGLPAHRAKCVAEYVQQWKGFLELHFLPGYAPELNPDEFVWNYVKSEGPAKRPLKAGESLKQRVSDILTAIKKSKELVKSFFRAESVSYI